MILAISWCSPVYCGVVTSEHVGSESFKPPLLSNDELTKLVGRSMKYLSRMTGECRNSLCAAALAMKSCGWLHKHSTQTGLLAAGYEGCLAADQNYFRDYLAGGRSLARGNLFIYTLPTSSLGELAIALSLTGPSMHIEASANPLAALSRHANQIIADGEADTMLAIWNDATASVCLAIDGKPGPGLPIPEGFSDPTSLAAPFDSIANRA